MLNPRHHPIHILFWAALIPLLTTVYLLGRRYDFHFHDTYLNTSAEVLYPGMAISLFIIWIINVIAKKIVYSTVLTWIQIILVLIGTGMLLATLWFRAYEGLAGSPRRYYDPGFPVLFNQVEQSGIIIQTALLTLILGILILAFNILLGLIAKLISPAKRGHLPIQEKSTD